MTGTVKNKKANTTMRTAIMLSVEDFIKKFNLAADKVEKFLEELSKWSSGRAKMSSVYSQKLLKDIYSLSC